MIYIIYLFLSVTVEEMREGGESQIPTSLKEEIQFPECTGTCVTLIVSILNSLGKSQGKHRGGRKAGQVKQAPLTLEDLSTPVGSQVKNTVNRQNSSWQVSWAGLALSSAGTSRGEKDSLGRPEEGEAARNQ